MFGKKPHGIKALAPKLSIKNLIPRGLPRGMKTSTKTFFKKIIPRGKKTPDYLKAIGLILGAIIVLVLILNLVSYYFGWLNNSAQIQIPSQAKSPYISQNLMTFLKDQGPTAPQIGSHSPILGDTKAPLTIFEYNSFDCPYGAQVQTALKQVLTKYGAQVKLVWKDLPAAAVNLAHQAARCAQKQNKFWEYAEQLWQTKNDLTADNLKKLAGSIGLDRKKFDACLKNQEVMGWISEDLKEANDLMIPASPYFYINGQELMGAVNFADFEQIIQTELNRQ